MLMKSNMNYSVNKQGNIRFGLGAIKGVGSSAAEFIINEMKKIRDHIMIYLIFLFE